MKQNNFFSLLKEFVRILAFFSYPPREADLYKGELFLFFLSVTSNRIYGQYIRYLIRFDRGLLILLKEGKGKKRKEREGKG